MSTTLVCAFISALFALLSRVFHPSERLTENLLSTSASLAVVAGVFFLINFFFLKLPPYEAGEHLGAMIGSAIPIVFIKGSILHSIVPQADFRKTIAIIALGILGLVALFAYSVAEQFREYRAEWKPVATSLAPRYKDFKYWFDPKSVMDYGDTRSVVLLSQWPNSFQSDANSAIAKLEIRCGNSQIRQVYATTFYVADGDGVVVHRFFQKEKEWQRYPPESVFSRLEREVCSSSVRER